MKRMIREKEESICSICSEDGVKLEVIEKLYNILKEGEYLVGMRRGHWFEDDDDFDIEFVKYKWREETEFEVFEREQSQLKWKQIRLESLQKETARLKDELKEANK